MNAVKQLNTSQAFFIPNTGLYIDEVLFYSQKDHSKYFFLKDRIVCAQRIDGNEEHAFSLYMRFLDSNPDAVTGADKIETAFNYFKGKDPSKWRSKVPSFGSLHYAGVWDGIDLTVAHEAEGLKLNWFIEPHAIPDAIRIKFEGADFVDTDGHGNLKIRHPFGEITNKAPVAYQEINGERVYVDCKYTNDGDFTVGFSVGGYNPDYLLVIDPLLPYSTYLGGDESESVFALTVPTTPGSYRPDRMKHPPGNLFNQVFR